MADLKRLHLFEFEDQSWFPSIFSVYITDYLKYITELGDFHKPITALIKEVMKKVKRNQIIDLCSGSDSAIVIIQEDLKQDGLLVHLLLTDKFPNEAAIREYNNPTLSWIKESVDATSVPSHLKCLRTLFNALHHFKPEQAKKILHSAVRSNSPIGVFEFSNRTLLIFYLLLLLFHF